MRGEDPDTLVNTVLTHRNVLESLFDAPKTKPELIDECGVSRSTIDRWLNELEASDLVHRPRDRFEPTLFGRLVTQEYNEMHARITQLLDARDALTLLSDQTEIDPGVVKNAEVASYTGLAPQLSDELLGHPGRVRLVAPLVPLVSSLLLYRDPNPEIELEVILDSAGVSQLEEYYSDHQESLLAVADVEIFKIASPPPVCLGLVERNGTTELYLIFWGPVNSVGVVKNDSQEAVAWGEAMYKEYRDDALSVRSSVIEPA